MCIDCNRFSSKNHQYFCISSPTEHPCLQMSGLSQCRRSWIICSMRGANPALRIWCARCSCRRWALQFLVHGHNGSLLLTPSLGKQTVMGWDLHSSQLICFMSVPGTKNFALVHQQTIFFSATYRIGTAILMYQWDHVALRVNAWLRSLWPQMENLIWGHLKNPSLQNAGPRVGITTRSPLVEVEAITKVLACCRWSLFITYRREVFRQTHTNFPFPTFDWGVSEVKSPPLLLLHKGHSITWISR